MSAKVVSKSGELLKEAVVSQMLAPAGIDKIFRGFRGSGKQDQRIHDCSIGRCGKEVKLEREKINQEGLDKEWMRALGEESVADSEQSIFGMPQVTYCSMNALPGFLGYSMLIWTSTRVKTEDLGIIFLRRWGQYSSWIGS